MAFCGVSDIDSVRVPGDQGSRCSCDGEVSRIELSRSAQRTPGHRELEEGLCEYRSGVAFTSNSHEPATAPRGGRPRLWFTQKGCVISVKCDPEIRCVGCLIMQIMPCRIGASGSAPWFLRLGKDPLSPLPHVRVRPTRCLSRGPLRGVGIHRTSPR